MSNDVTTITARLPNLTMEIGRSAPRDGEPGESVTIRLTATPDLESVAAMMAPMAFNPAMMMGMAMPPMSPMAAMSSMSPIAGLPTAGAADPMRMWGDMMQAAWVPWLRMMGGR